MSGNRRKQTSTKPPANTEESVAARVVAIPKDPIAKPAAQAKPRSERIGDILRQSRLDRNEDLYQIAEYLCIKPPFLIALENSNYDAFPADAYVIGFLRTYANFLGVDGKDAVDRYRYEMAGRRKKPVLSMPQPMTEGRAPSGIIMVGVTIAILLIYASWYGLSSSNRAEVSVAPPLPTTQQVVPSTAPDVAGPAAGLTAPITVPAAPSDTPSTTSITPPPPVGIPLAGTAPQSTLAKEEPAPASALKDADKNPPPSSPATTAIDSKDAKDAKDGKKQIYGDPNEASHVVIRATQSSWVMVSDDSGKAIFDHVLKPGDIYKVPNKPGLSLTTGNGSGLTLSLNGTDLPKVASGAPHVVRNIPLDPDRLSAPPSSDQ